MKTLIDRKKESNKNLERKKTLMIYPSTIITRISADEIDHDAHLCRKRKKKNKKKKRERERGRKDEQLLGGLLRAREGIGSARIMDRSVRGVCANNLYIR